VVLQTHSSYRACTVRVFLCRPTLLWVRCSCNWSRNGADSAPMENLLLRPAQLDLMVVTQEIWSALTVPYIRYKDGQASHAIPPHRRHGS